MDKVMTLLYKVFIWKLFVIALPLCLGIFLIEVQTHKIICRIEGVEVYLVNLAI